jgi:hypothetical protein
MVTSERKLLEQMNATDPVYCRGDWKHYRCPFCPDRGAHLGINGATGAIRCLRCDYTGSIDVGRTDLQVRAAPPMLWLDGYWSGTGEKADGKLRDFMSAQRRVYRQDLWFRGANDAEGCPVFRSTSPGGETRYLQWLTPSGYRAPSNSHPYLDHCTYGEIKVVMRNVLVLTEGPIDALRVRQALDMWTSPNYGVTVKSDIVGEIVSLADKLDMVMLFFDNDDAGRRGAAEHVSLLRMHGVRRVMGVGYDPRMSEDADPGSLTDEQIREQVHMVVSAL